MTKKRYSSALRLLADSGYLDCYVGSLSGPKPHVLGSPADGQGQDDDHPLDMSSVALNEFRDETARWRIPLSASFTEAYNRHQEQLQRDRAASGSAPGSVY